MSPERLHQADLHGRVVVIIEALNGLPVGEAEHVLNEAARILKTIVKIDTNGPGFNEMLQHFRDLYGDIGDASSMN